MSNYTLDEVLKDCQKLKNLRSSLGYKLTDFEIEMIGLAYIRGEQRQLEKHIADLDLVKKTKRRDRNEKMEH
tara:strand:- start:28 stop:243 length:216 start_codon:yes stop_codon:yes gene_type:complete